MTRHFFSCMRWILLFIKQIKFKQKKNIHYKYFSDNINCRYFHKCCFNKNMCEKSALNNAMIKEALSTLRVLCISTMSLSLSLSMNLFWMLLPHFESLPIQFSLTAGRSRGKDEAARRVTEGCLVERGAGVEGGLDSWSLSIYQ